MGLWGVWVWVSVGGWGSVHAHGDVAVMDFVFALFSRCSNCFVLSPNNCKNTHHFVNRSCFLFCYFNF